MIEWKVPQNMWEDGECWIIGGGSSLPRQFDVPEYITREVLSGKQTVESYSPFLHVLHDKHVIGTNMAYLLGDWLSFVYYGDKQFFKRNMYQIQQSKVMFVTHSNVVGDRECHKEIRHLRVDQNGYGLSTNPRYVRWNKSSGGAAINFAALTGVKRILLLGYDMMTLDSYSHWHSSYKGYRPKAGTYERFLKGFPKIADDAKKLGIEILNVNSKEMTAIKEFPIVSLNDVL